MLLSSGYMTISLATVQPDRRANAAPLRPSDLPRQLVDALYVHIPFCFHKCHYCDFYSITRQGPDRMARFTDLILREAEMWTRSDAPPLRPRTIFFGGGTPTLLPIDEMRRLIAGLRERIDFSDVDEFTSEANPATVSLEYCRMLRESGVDRMSFGAQSFDRAELATLERHHNPDDVPVSVELARKAGFERLNIDLIYAIPGQDLASWSRTLETALQLNLKHLSCYGLTFEANTPIAVKKRLGTMIPAKDEVELEMLWHARNRLTEVSLPPYEISNYAAPGEECRHNLHYWTGGSYVGLGPSAASHVHGTRFKNRPHLGEWERAIELNELPATDVEVLSPVQRAGELAMLTLRLTRGLKFDDFAGRTGHDARTLFVEQISQLSRQKLLHLDEHHISLSESGINVADAVAAEFVQLA
ncbi:MAG: radical SAM family heme chaperone HemW [Anaerolineae bacterium]|nr:radical SAM family heme chaperone HemW [Phycisphaerae bacterium]